MQRSPNDARDPQDQQRLLIFLLLSASILMFWGSFNRKAVAPEDKQAVQAEEADGGAGAPGAKVAATDDVATTDDPADADTPDEEDGDQPIAEAPPAKPQAVTLGSADPAGDYRMMMVLTNQGAAVRRLALSSKEFSDIDHRHGSLGVVEVGPAPGGGAALEVVGPGTPADRAGLKQGDVIKSGEPGNSKSKLKKAEFENAAQLLTWLSKSKAGESVKLEAAPAGGGPTRTVTVTLERPELQVIRPESENVLLHQEKLPEDFADRTSLLVRLASVGELQADSAELKLANKRLVEDAWTIESSAAAEATFSMRLAKLGLEVVKRYQLVATPEEERDDKDYAAYHFEFEIEIRNLRDKPQAVAYELEGPNGLPIEGFWYANKIGRKENGSGSWGSVGLRDVIVRYQGKHVSQLNPTNIAKGKYDQFGQGAPMAYIGLDAQYFATMLIPQKESLDEVWFDFGEAKLATQDLGKRVKTTYNNPTFRLTRLAVTLAATGEKLSTQADRFTVFAGPKRPELLAKYRPADDQSHSLRNILYYGWFDPVARLMLRILHTFHSVVRNYGIAIVLLTVVVRLLMFPLSRKQAMNMVKMQELKPEIDRIAEKYKTDMQKRTSAQQELFRKHNYNPMGGCLLMFFQLPVFLGLYRALAVDVELREASLLGTLSRFCSNLAAPDMFYNWSWLMPHSVNTGNGFFGVGPYLNLLPIVTIVLFLLQQKMFMPEPANEQAAMQQKMMKYMMLFMGFMFFKVPSGLCLYFIASSIWGITERKMLPHAKPADTPSPSARTEPPKRSSGSSNKNSGNKSSGGKNAKKKKRKR